MLRTEPSAQPLAGTEGLGGALTVLSALIASLLLGKTLDLRPLPSAPPGLVKFKESEAAVSGLRQGNSIYSDLYMVDGDLHGPLCVCKCK